MNEDKDWIYMLGSLQAIKSFNRTIIRRGNKAYSLQGEEIELLSYLEINKEKVTAMELSKVMKVNKTTISRVLDGLKDKGYIKKSMDKKDKRKSLLTITKLGKGELDHIYQYYLHPIYELRRKLGDEKFSKLMEAINDANIEMNKLGESEKK